MRSKRFNWQLSLSLKLGPISDIHSNSIIHYCSCKALCTITCFCRHTRYRIGMIHVNLNAEFTAWKAVHLNITIECLKLCAWSGCGHLEPEFVDVVQNITVPVGRDVKFSCHVRHLGTNYKVSRQSAPSFILFSPLRARGTNFFFNARSIKGREGDWRFARSLNNEKGRESACSVLFRFYIVLLCRANGQVTSDVRLSNGDNQVDPAAFTQYGETFLSMRGVGNLI